MAALTCVDAVVRLQLVLEAEPLAAAVALVRLLPRVDALVAPQGPVVSEAAPAVLTLERVVACKQRSRVRMATDTLAGSTQGSNIRPGLFSPRRHRTSLTPTPLSANG